MRKTLSLLTLAVGMAFAAQTQAHGVHFDNDQCGFSTRYDVHVNALGIAFDRAGGKPASVFMHDGRLRVDGQPLAVSGADAERLRQYENQVRALLPEVAGIVREGLDIGFSAMTTVATTFAENGEERSELLDRLNRKHAAALKQVDQGIGAGVWKQHDMAQGGCVGGARRFAGKDHRPRSRLTRRPARRTRRGVVPTTDRAGTAAAAIPVPSGRRFAPAVAEPRARSRRWVRTGQ